MGLNSCGFICKLKKRLIGELLLSGKFIDETTLKKAIEAQKKNK